MRVWAAAGAQAVWEANEPARVHLRTGSQQRRGCATAARPLHEAGIRHALLLIVMPHVCIALFLQPLVKSYCVVAIALHMTCSSVSDVI